MGFQIFITIVIIVVMVGSAKTVESTLKYEIEKSVEIVRGDIDLKVKNNMIDIKNELASYLVIFDSISKEMVKSRELEHITDKTKGMQTEAKDIQMDLIGIKENVDYTSNEVLEEICDCAMNVFCKGIYVKSDKHPCGWDFITFEWVNEDFLNYKFELSDISDGCYDDHHFEGLTLKEILIKANGKFAFEIQNIDW